MKLHYALTIDVLSSRDLSFDVEDEILTSAEPHDKDWSDKVRRFVGGALQTGERTIADALPEGFAVRIDDVAPVDQVTL